jgi:hypothetical protein
MEDKYVAGRVKSILQYHVFRFHYETLLVCDENGTKVETLSTETITVDKLVYFFKKNYFLKAGIAFSEECTRCSKGGVLDIETLLIKGNRISLFEIFDHFKTSLKTIDTLHCMKCRRNREMKREVNCDDNLFFNRCMCCNTAFYKTVCGGCETENVLEVRNFLPFRALCSCGKTICVFNGYIIAN